MLKSENLIKKKTLSQPMKQRNEDECEKQY